MMTTPEEKRRLLVVREKIRLYSDGPLYKEATAFIEAQGTVDGQTQMTSLLNYTQTWGDLINFVRQQSRRDWIGRKTYYRQFYTALEAYLNELRQRIEKEWFPPDPDLSKREKRDWVEEHAILAGREFAQHLAAENLYREKVK